MANCGLGWTRLAPYHGGDDGLLLLFLKVHDEVVDLTGHHGGLALHPVDGGGLLLVLWLGLAGHHDGGNVGDAAGGGAVLWLPRPADHHPGGVVAMWVRVGLSTGLYF